MRLLMFCENANQVHLCHTLVASEFFPSHIEPEVLILDWDRETVAWVVGSVSTLGWEVSVSNVYDSAPARLQKALQSAKNGKERKSALVDIGFEYLKQYFGRADVLLLQFNDASLRGSSIAAVCRNTGLRRLLIQDGFLNFASKTNNLASTDQNYYWGATHPEFVAVWGQAMKDALVQRHNANAASIRICGPAKPEISVPSTVAHAPHDRSIKVLWADQAILDQNKADRESWLSEFADIARSLSQFDTSLRLHPSTKERSRAALEGSVGECFSVLLTGSPKIGEDEIRQHDVVVTYYSTVFLDCLANNIPCVIYKTKAVDIELPQIEHPLLSYCSSVEDLPAAIQRAAKCDFNGEAPQDIFRYVARKDGVMEIVSLLSEAMPPTKEERSAIIHPVVRDITIYSNVRRLLGKKVLVIGGSFGNHIGVGKPIKVFVEYLRGLDLEIEFHLATNGDRENLLTKVAGASLVLINSFDVVRILKEGDLAEVAKICQMRSTPIVFYCHETQFVFRRLMAEVGGKVEAFVKNILPNCHALAVSDRQADWLGTLGCRSIRTVYNSIGSKFVPVERTVDESRPIVLMVGTQQRRKGVELFSHVADIAKRRDLDWRFVWLGSYTKAADGCYRSEAVEWVGHVSPEDVRHWLSRSSVFFLSSIDDPLPLGVGEALMCGIPSLVYAETGFSDFITLHQAGEVFNIYEPHVALDKLKTMIARRGDYSIEPALVRDIVGVEAFGRRMLTALGEILAAEAAEYAYRKQISGPVALHRVLNGNGKPPNQRKKGLKWRILYSLEENLPAIIVKRGEKALKRIGMI